MNSTRSHAARIRKALTASAPPRARTARSISGARAAAIALLDVTLSRGEEYERTNGSFGLTTMRIATVACSRTHRTPLRESRASSTRTVWMGAWRPDRAVRKVRDRAYSNAGRAEQVNQRRSVNSTSGCGGAELSAKVSTWVAPRPSAMAAPLRRARRKDACAALLEEVGATEQTHGDRTKEYVHRPSFEPTWRSTHGSRRASAAPSKTRGRLLAVLAWDARGLR